MGERKDEPPKSAEGPFTLRLHALTGVGSSPSLQSQNVWQQNKVQTQSMQIIHQVTGRIKKDSERQSWRDSERRRKMRWRRRKGRGGEGGKREIRREGRGRGRGRKSRRGTTLESERRI